MITKILMSIDGIPQITEALKNIFSFNFSLNTFYGLIEGLNSLIWGLPMIVLIFSLGIYFTFKLGFIQKHLFKGIRLSVSKDDSEGEVSNFGALAVTIAATVGTGSIIGVTTAVALGGPGSIFWMVAAGFFAFVTKYAECFLSVKYRVKLESGEYVGGPMYVLKNALKDKKMGIAFAIATLIMAVIAGGALQANSIADALREGYNVNPWYSGVLVAFFTAVVVLGGVKRIATFCEWLVPIMGGIYLLSALAIAIMFYDRVPGAIWAIFNGAFTGAGAAGGIAGAGIMGVTQAIISSLRAGVSRSVLSTEAGMGSAPIVAAAAKTDSAVRQAYISATSVFWAVIICTLTGLVIVIAGDWQNPNVFAANLCNSAFSSIPYVGTPILIFSLAIFSFTTIIGWCYYGEKVLQFLEGDSWIMPFRVFWILFMVAGAGLGAGFSFDFFLADAAAKVTESNSSTRFMWALTVFAMSFMAIINIYSIIRLRKVIKEDTDKYFEREVLGR